LLHTTDRAFRLVVSDSWLAGLLRTKIIARIAAFAMSLARVRTFAFRTVSQTGIHYRASALSESLESLPATVPRAGDRFPWLRLKFLANGPVEDSFQSFDDMHFNLVVIGQPPPPEGSSGLGDLLRVHTIPADPENEAELARAQIPRPSFYLVRPDGHVGLCGVRLDATAVRRYVTERLRIAAKGT
jgi:hypothetical protein